MDKKATYKILAVVFGVLALYLLVYGLFFAYKFFKLICILLGLVNGAIAFYCKQESK